MQGSSVAKKLEKSFDVTLIDLTDYFEFTPGVLRTIIEPEHMGKYRFKHQDYLKKTEVIIGKVKEIAKTYVKVGSKR